MCAGTAAPGWGAAIRQSKRATERPAHRVVQLDHQLHQLLAVLRGLCLEVLRDVDDLKLGAQLLTWGARGGVPTQVQGAVPEALHLLCTHRPAAHTDPRKEPACAKVKPRKTTPRTAPHDGLHLHQVNDALELVFAAYGELHHGGRCTQVLDHLAAGYGRVCWHVSKNQPTGVRAAARETRGAPLSRTQASARRE